MSAIKDEGTEKNLSVAEVIAMWDDIYCGECKGKISNFHDWAVRSGKVRLKRARGKSRNEND